MKIKEIEFGRTFNLVGKKEYESKRISLRAEITELENLKEVYEKLNKEIVELYLLENKFEVAEKQAKQQVLNEIQKTQTINTPTKLEKIIEDINKEIKGLSKEVNISFSDDEKRIFIHPIKFLGTDNFGKLYNIISGTFGGRYISDGANSHFVVYVD